MASKSALFPPRGFAPHLDLHGQARALHATRRVDSVPKHAHIHTWLDLNEQRGQPCVPVLGRGAVHACHFLCAMFLSVTTRTLTHPNRQYRGMRVPTTPATTGPVRQGREAEPKLGV